LRGRKGEEFFSFFSFVPNMFPTCSLQVPKCKDIGGGAKEGATPSFHRIFYLGEPP